MHADPINCQMFEYAHQKPGETHPQNVIALNPDTGHDRSTF